MPRITTQREFAEHKQLHFCYLCGEPLDNGLLLDDDHCPPISFFHATDRTNYPIKLKVHKECNHAQHLNDDILSLLFDRVSGRGKAADVKHRKRMAKHKKTMDCGDCTLSGYTGLPLEGLAWRIVRCMHALLYREAPPRELRGHVMFPFGRVDQRGRLISHEMSAVSLSMSRKIAASVQADTFDYVTAYNGKFKYVSCWSSDDSGKPICLFAFDVLNMAQMAYPLPGLPKAVIGHYTMNPPNSTYSKATRLELPLVRGEVEYPLPA